MHRTRIYARLTKSTHACRQKCEVLVDENRQLRKDMQELETELFQVRILCVCLPGVHEEQRLSFSSFRFHLQLQGLIGLFQV